VRSVVSQLVAGRTVQHAYLGVAVSDTSSGGARIAQVRSGTPAAAAGLKAGDLVVAVDGRRIFSGEALRAAIEARRPGATVTLRVVRGGATLTVRAHLATRPS
jgi:putative serine protease PepD